ncbi:WD40 repeat-like protein [Microthyrium microscopicum]|uniref:WD40 repeat-like protein n=1 Tax=Microthyrium microscopicum TaxID=703497 RepID=A0A6A6U7A6_9PEZI|nr:WD40 repeat-like protein [Microthyrium microscopicum]
MLQLRSLYAFQGPERLLYAGFASSTSIGISTDNGAIHVLNADCELLYVRQDDPDLVTSLDSFAFGEDQLDEMLVVSGKTSLTICNSATGAICHEFPVDHQSHIGKIKALQLGESQSKGSGSIVLAVAGLKGNIHLLDFDSSGMKLRCTLTGHTQAITCLSLHPHNSHLLVSSSYDGSIRVWSMETGSQTLLCALRDDEKMVRTSVDSKGHTRTFIEGASSMLATSDGRLIAGGVGGFKLQHSWQAHFGGHRLVGPVLNKILLHPSKEAFITTGTDGNVCLWNLKTYELFRRIKAFEHSVLRETVIWLNNKLICAGKDGAPENSCGDFIRVVVWDLEKLKLEKQEIDCCNDLGIACNFVHYILVVGSRVILLVNRRGKINVEA